MVKMETNPLVVALDIGGTNSRGEVLPWAEGALGTPIARASLPTPAGDGDAVLATIVALVHDLLDQLDEQGREQVEAIGVGVPGIHDDETGVVRLAANLGWVNRPVARELTDALGLPVYLCHDVTAAGIGEQRLGAGCGAPDTLAVFLGTGIAATIVSNDKLIRGGMLHGARQPAGEIGHMPIVLDGLECACGQRGCFEMYCSARAFGRIYSEHLGVDPEGPEGKTSKDLVDALPHDPTAREAWDLATRYLAHGLLSAATVTGPSRIVLGGGLSAAGEVLTDAVSMHLKEMAKVLQVPEVVLAELGPRAGTLGVALLTLDRLL
ncbi:ROK family protein [Populibacterium corticicola]|jgi:glucokinase|uniref:ROK family protein n=1 Tax=Populibacterium corticicola TaxID=1812826 RepID=A0ABW5XDM2_9MICO